MATLAGHTKAAPVDWTRAMRRALVCSLVIVAGFGLAGSLMTLSPLFAGDFSGVGMDLSAYLGYTRTWMATGEWYAPAQLSGPYVVEQLTGNVYPPTLLYLTIPFTVLPAVLWWVIPFSIAGLSLRRLRVSPRALLVLAVFLVCYPRWWIVVMLGNPSLWVFAFLLAGLAWGWPSVLVLFKLTFAPLVLVGLPRSPRAWFLALGVCLVLAVPFWSLWGEYLAVLANTRSARGLPYVLGEWPIAISVLAAGMTPRAMAWRGARRGPAPVQHALRREPLPRD